MMFPWNIYTKNMNNFPDRRPMWVSDTETLKEINEEWEKHHMDKLELVKHDPVNHPKHYTNHPSGVECIQITEHMSFTLGNAVKYIWRADLKNGVEDIEKAIWYLQRELAKRKKA